MKNSIAKKQEAFRNSIRRQEIEEYKKNRRRELLQSVASQEQNNQTYQAVLSHHCVKTLLQMNQDCLSDHLQMLNELVFADNNQIYKDCFDKVLVILIDYYEAIQDVFMREGAQKLLHLDEESREEILQIYYLTKMFTFVPPNAFLKLIGGIYYEVISSANLMYVEKVVKILEQLLHFVFKDSQTIRHQLQNFPEELDFKLNINIYRNHIFTVILNITFSEQKQIVDILSKQCIFQTLIDAAETYGLNGKEIVLLSEIYQNTVYQLCEGIQYYSLQHQHQDNIGLQAPKINSHHIYVPLFEYLVGVFDLQIASNLTKIANILIQTTLKHDLDCLKNLMYQTQLLIRGIIQKESYIDGSEKLFITFAMSYSDSEQSVIWLTDFFQLSFKQITCDIANQHNDPQRRKKSGQKLKELIRDCSRLLRKENAPYQLCLYLVRQIFQFWLKGDIAIGNEEVILFLKTAIQSDEDLSKYLIYEEYSLDFLIFLGNQFHDTKEVVAILRLIQLVCLHIKQSNFASYSRNHQESLPEWQTVLQRIQGYEGKGENFDKSYHQQCSNAYNQVQTLIYQLSEHEIQ